MSADATPKAGRAPLAAPSVPHRGTPMELGGLTYIVPPLSLGAIEANEEHIENVDSLPRGQQLRLIVTLAHCALKRNYPELTRDQVADLVDLANANAVYSTVMSASVPKAEEGDPKGGASAGTGQPSTPI
jgi:hypothetical protein